MAAQPAMQVPWPELQVANAAGTVSEPVVNVSACNDSGQKLAAQGSKSDQIAKEGIAHKKREFRVRVR